MSADRIREAIQWGQTAPDSELEQYDVHTERTWLVNFDTPFLRVAQFARAMKLQNRPLSDADVSPQLSDESVHLYVHARFDSGDPDVALPNVDYVTITRPGQNSRPTEMVRPTSIRSFVRRVPVSDDYDGPARIAKSVKVVFPLSALVPDCQIRITFQGGGMQTVKIDEKSLARVR